MARSFVGSNKSNIPDTKSNNNIKGLTGNSNLMTTSMPSSVLNKALYSNLSSSNKKNNNSTNYSNKNVANKRNPVPKTRQNLSEGVKKVPRQTHANQVSSKVSS